MKRTWKESETECTWQKSRTKHTRKIILDVMLVLLAVVLTGCMETQTGNRVTHGKDVQTFTYAYIRLGDKDIVEGYITQWRDYDNSDTVQIMIDGKYYLTHYTNVILIADPSQGALQYADPEYFTDE